MTRNPNPAGAANDPCRNESAAPHAGAASTHAPTRAEIAAEDGRCFPGRSYAEAVLSPIYDSAKDELLEPMMAIHRAHLVMLVEQGLVDAGTARKILAGLASIDLGEVAASRYDGRYEDLFFYVEDLTLKAAGEEAGNLHIARSRNDMGVTMYRMVLRKHLLDAIEAAQLLHRVLLRFAAEEADTVMLAHTHTQQAQPTTLGHWLTAAADVLERDIARMQAAYERANRSPMGAAALSTSGFPISRERVAELLGFDGLVENSYDAIAGADYVSEAAAAVQLTALHTGRMVQDLLLWCTQEYGALRVADPYVQTSSIMPQKRNPVSLEHARTLLSYTAGRAQTVLQMLHNTPFGDIVDTEDEMQPNLWAALSTLRSVFRLLANVVGTAEVNRDLLLERARASFANVTELADLLVREAGLPFRTAHGVVAALVKAAEARGIRDVRDVDPGMVEEAAQKVLGRPLGVPAEKLRLALDPVHFVAVRTVRGGVAPAEVRRMLAEREARAAAMAGWLDAARARLAAAAQRLNSACLALSGEEGGRG